MTNLHILFFALLAAGSLAQDSNPIQIDGSRLDENAVSNSFAIDTAVKKAQVVVIGRMVTEGGWALGGYGIHAYARDFEVTTRLYGECPAKVICRFHISHVDINQNRGTAPYKSFPPPPLHQELIAVGSVRTIDYPPVRVEFEMVRVLEPTPDNLRLIERLIRETKAKELAADPAKEKQLVEGLAAAVKAVVRPVPDKVEAKQEDESVPASDDSWWWIGGGVLLAAALLIWRQQRIRKE